LPYLRGVRKKKMMQRFVEDLKIWNVNMAINTGACDGHLLLLVGTIAR